VGIKIFFGAVAGELSFIGKTTYYHLLLNLFILIMGKSKDIAANEIMPSSTRGGTNLPSRPNFSPANAALVIKKKSATLHISALSKMSMPTNTKNEPLDDSMDDEVTHDSSNPSSSKIVESNREGAKANASKSIPPYDTAAFGRALVDADLDGLDKFDALIMLYWRLISNY
jgi:hypothetical protein